VPESYSDAALRHSQHADYLADGGHLDGAGYLIGFAVECAIKHAVASVLSAASVSHVHLPALLEKSKKALQGRKKHSLVTVLHQPQFMQDWCIDVRYAADGSVDKNKYDRWRLDANRALGAAGLRRKQ